MHSSLTSIVLCALCLTDVFIVAVSVSGMCQRPTILHLAEHRSRSVTVFLTSPEGWLHIVKENMRRHRRTESRHREARVPDDLIDALTDTV